jgi:hypothetical protein
MGIIPIEKEQSWTWTAPPPSPKKIEQPAQHLEDVEIPAGLFAQLNLL